MTERLSPVRYESLVAQADRLGPERLAGESCLEIRREANVSAEFSSSFRFAIEYPGTRAGSVPIRG